MDKCVYCGGENFEVISTKLRFNKKGMVVRCGCGLVRLRGATEKETKIFYEKEYAKEYQGGCDELFYNFLPLQKNRIDKFRKYLKNGESLCEIGSSVGYLLYSLKNIETCGVELNTQERAYANERGIRTLKQISGEFDHICLFQLLEHTPDPIFFLKDLRKHLRGYIHIEVPNINDPLLTVFQNEPYKDFFYQEPHLYYFSPETLRNIVEKAGYDVVSMEPFQLTSLTNNFHWHFTGKPQDNKFKCTKNPNEIIGELDVVYKNLLGDCCDNIFCTIR